MTQTRNERRPRTCSTCDDALKNVRVALAARGLTQGQLAERCGVSDATISRVLSGWHARPALVDAIAKVLAVYPAVIRRLERIHDP